LLEHMHSQHELLAPKSRDGIARERNNAKMAILHT
jgi:hypothetical protein